MDDKRKIHYADVWPLDGWETLAGWVICRATLDVGYRSGGEMTAEQTRNMTRNIAFAEDNAARWEPLTLARATRPPESEWDLWHPFGDGRGVSAALVALVDRLHPGGEWRMGQDPEHTCRVGKFAPMLTKVIDGVPVALVAPLDYASLTNAW